MPEPYLHTSFPRLGPCRRIPQAQPPPSPITSSLPHGTLQEKKKVPKPAAPKKSGSVLGSFASLLGIGGGEEEEAAPEEAAEAESAAAEAEASPEEDKKVEEEEWWTIEAPTHRNNLTDDEAYALIYTSGTGYLDIYDEVSDKVMRAPGGLEKFDGQSGSRRLTALAWLDLAAAKDPKLGAVLAKYAEGGGKVILPSPSGPSQISPDAYYETVMKP